MISLTSCRAGYGQGEVLHGIDIDVHPGQILAILGPNGAGKTSLMRAIIGALPEQTGDLRVDGTPVRPHTPAQARRRRIAHVPEGRGIFGGMTTHDNLLLGGGGLDGAAVREGLENAYARFPILKTRRKQKAGTLSGGEQQMLAIARALMARPRYILVDEPSLGLAPRLVVTVFELLRELADDAEVGILVAEQTRSVAGYADAVNVISQGRIVATGAASQLSSEELFQLYVQGVVAPEAGGPAILDPTKGES
ncbi:MAG TPA: ABC transporter ATP-binding protein [Solirubrobacter sp.]|nr:ABC transporter ATP-binding protein [Solirubrobacter sp.]